MSEKKIIELHIGGRAYRVAVDDNENDVQRAARMVDTLISDIAEKTKITSEHKVAVLAALSFAADVARLERDDEAQAGHLKLISRALDQELGSLVE